MRSDIPKGNIDASANGKDPIKGPPTEQEAGDVASPSSLGLDILYATGNEDVGTGGIDLDGDGDGTHAFLMPHERKLPLAEQRRLLLMRRNLANFDDGIPPTAAGISAVVQQIGPYRSQHDPAIDVSNDQPIHQANPHAHAAPFASDADNNAGASSRTQTDEHVEPLADTDANSSSTSGGTHIEKKIATDVAIAVVNAQSMPLFPDNQSNDASTSGSGAGGGTHIEKKTVPNAESAKHAGKTDKASSGDNNSIVNIEKNAVVTKTSSTDPTAKQERPTPNPGDVLAATNGKANTEKTVGVTATGAHQAKSDHTGTMAMLCAGAESTFAQPVSATYSNTGTPANGGSEARIDRSFATAINSTAAQHTLSGDTEPRTERPASANAVAGHTEQRTDRPATGAATPAPGTTPSTQGAITPATNHAPLLSDARHPNNALFKMALQGVADLDPSKVPMNRAQQINTAAALTANMANIPGFNRDNPSASNLSVATSQDGTRLFAINNSNPSAPNAIYTSVELSQARTQSVEVSSAQAQSPAVSPTASQSQIATNTPQRGM